MTWIEWLYFPGMLTHMKNVMHMTWQKRAYGYMTIFSPWPMGLFFLNSLTKMDFHSHFWDLLERTAPRVRDTNLQAKCFFSSWNFHDILLNTFSEDSYGWSVHFQVHHPFRTHYTVFLYFLWMNSKFSIKAGKFNGFGSYYLKNTILIFRLSQFFKC